MGRKDGLKERKRFKMGKLDMCGMYWTREDTLKMLLG